jgi:phenylpyruvate tautomerase PptA (4-oxalocrotonate tautomerase family)
MPFCDAYISEGALSPSAERELLGKITDLLLEHEGVDPRDEKARMIAWVFVHRHEMYVAGAPAKEPRYRFVCQVPEGQYNDERRAAVIAAMTQAVVEAEDGCWPHPELRVVVFTNEIKDGTLGGAGRILRLPDIYERALGGKGHGREAAEQVLAARRRQEDWVVGGLDEAGVLSVLGERSPA